MRVPLSWMKEYVDLTVPVEHLADRLTQAGLEVGSIEVIGGSWDKVNVGLVVEVQPHPNADRLRLVTVDLGDRRQTVVCGAPNVAAGQKIAFASVGAKLLDGHTGQPATLKPAKIRGVVSEGMVCSEKELGISGNNEGIMVLPEGAPAGMPLRDYLGDTVFDVEATPNRPDWLSILGVAREVSALAGQPVRTPAAEWVEGTTPVSELARVEIMDADLCPRYTACVITGVRIGPSPRWMQRRLEAAGMRPINNVVDVTNYVMLEFGQPLHAFDYDCISDRHIIVRRAWDGETIVSLDGIGRELNSAMLVIADARRAVAVAGVMGGLNSEVSDRTTKVLLESANFNYASIRRTGGALNMRSEASMRFERGLSPELAVHALGRATQLIVETSGGEAAKGIIDVYPGKHERAPVLLAAHEVTRLLGMEVPTEQVKKTLESLGFSCRTTGTAEMAVDAPYWRTDVNLSADLVEEVARIIGYDNIPSTMIAAPIPSYRLEPMLVLKEQLRSILAASGLQEVITYSLTNLDSLKKAAQDMSLPGPYPLKIANPMSKEFEYLRTSLRPRLLATAAANQRYEDRIGLFEIGRVYIPRMDDMPDEVETLGIVMAGKRQERSWRTRDELLDFFDVKGILQAVLERLGVDAAFAAGEDPGLRQGRCARVISGDADLGVIGEVHPRVAEAFKAAGPAYLVELDLRRLLASISDEFRYQPLVRFPSILRDFAIVVDAGVRYQDVLDVVKGHHLVAGVVLFDVYEGDQVPKGKKSLAFSVTFQSGEHTLTDEEVNVVQQQMLQALAGRLGAALRA